MTSASDFSLPRQIEDYKALLEIEPQSSSLARTRSSGDGRGLLFELSNNTHVVS